MKNLPTVGLLAASGEANNQAPDPSSEFPGDQKVQSRAKLLAVIVGSTVGLAILCLLLFPFLGQLRSNQNAAYQLNSDRIRLLSPERVVKLINPAPGSTVLDIGAGYGLFTFPLAKTVGDSGTVFATDTDPLAIAYLKEQAAKRDIRNLVPVQVVPQGLDPFYSQHVFDVILAVDVVSLIPAPDVFFAHLRPSLKEGDGRLWIVDMRLDPDFASIEFPDAAALRAHFLSPRVKSSIWNRLGGSVQQALAAPSTAADDAAFQSLVIQELNRLLEDPSLWPEARAEKWPLNTREEKVRQYLSQVLENERAFSSSGATSPVTTKGVLRLLNRLVLQDILEDDQWEKPFILDQLDWSQWKPLLARLAAGQDYPALFGKWGYQLVAERTLLTYHRIWEFKTRLREPANDRSPMTDDR